MVLALRTSRFHHPVFEAAIKKSKPNISSGPDGFPPLLYKKLEHCIFCTAIIIVYIIHVSWLCATSLDPCYSHTGIVAVMRSKAINYLHLVAVVLRDADND